MHWLAVARYGSYNSCGSINPTDAVVISVSDKQIARGINSRTASG